MQDLLSDEKRLENILQSLALANRVLVTDDGQLVSVSRVVLPEYTKGHGIEKRLAKDKNHVKMSVHKFEMDDGATVHSIVVTVPQEYYQSKEAKKKTDDFIKHFQYRLVGPYLCYRRYTDDKIRIRKVLSGEGDK